MPIGSWGSRQQSVIAASINKYCAEKNALNAELKKTEFKIPNQRDQIINKVGCCIQNINRRLNRSATDVSWYHLENTWQSVLILEDWEFRKLKSTRDLKRSAFMWINLDIYLLEIRSFQISVSHTKKRSLYQKKKEVSVNVLAPDTWHKWKELGFARVFLKIR